MKVEFLLVNLKNTEYDTYPLKNASNTKFSQNLFKSINDELHMLSCTILGTTKKVIYKFGLSSVFKAVELNKSTDEN